MLHGHGDQIGDGILEFLRQLGRVGLLIRRCPTACAVRMALRRGHQRETLSSSSELGSEPHRGLDIRRAIEGGAASVVRVSRTNGSAPRRGAGLGTGLESDTQRAHAGELEAHGREVVCGSLR